MMLTQEYRKALESGALVQQRTAERMTPEQRNALAYAAGLGLTPGTEEYRTAYLAKFEELTAKAGRTETFGAEREAIARELYGKPVSQLTQPEIAAVNKRVEGAGKPPAVGSEAERVALAEFDKPFAQLTPEQRRKVNAMVETAATTRARAGATNVTQVGEKAEAGEFGKMLVKDFIAVRDQATVGQRSLPALETNLAVLDKGFDTGFGTETKSVGAKVLAAFGIKDAEKYATDAQTFLANASAAVLQRQLEQKGPQTEADAQRITQTGAQLGNTKEANRFLLSVARAQIKRDMAQRDFYIAWRADKKTYSGAEEAWLKGEGGKSLFERPELKAYAARGTAAAQIPTTAATPPAAATPPGMPAGFRVIRTPNP
jgi:hypothetical protein